MNNTDKELLEELCKQYQVSFDKICKLLDTIKEYQFRDRRSGIYDALRGIIKSDLNSDKV